MLALVIAKSYGLRMWCLPSHAESQPLPFLYTGVYSFEGREWEVVTDAAKDMITLMLVMDITDRANAVQLLKHRWFQVRA